MNKVCETGPLVYRPYPRRLESLCQKETLIIVMGHEQIITKYRKRQCISRTFFHKIQAQNQGCGLSTDTSVFGVEGAAYLRMRLIHGRLR